MDHGQSKPMKIVYTIVERTPGKSYWVRIGAGFVNKDGSLNLKLDAVPTNGTLQVRDWEPPPETAENGASRPRTRPPGASLGLS